MVSFAVNSEFYFTSLLLHIPRRLVVARKRIFKLTVRNELNCMKMHVGRGYHFKLQHQEYTE